MSYALQRDGGTQCDAKFLMQFTHQRIEYGLAGMNFSTWEFPLSPPGACAWGAVR